MDTKVEYLHIISEMRSKAESSNSASIILYVISHTLENTPIWVIARKTAGGQMTHKECSIKVLVGYYQSKHLIGNISEGTTSIINTPEKVASESTAYGLVFNQDADAFIVYIKAAVGRDIMQASGGLYL